MKWKIHGIHYEIPNSLFYQNKLIKRVLWRRGAFLAVGYSWCMHMITAPSPLRNRMLVSNRTLAKVKFMATTSITLKLIHRKPRLRFLSPSPTINLACRKRTCRSEDIRRHHCWLTKTIYEQDGGNPETWLARRSPEVGLTIFQTIKKTSAPCNFNGYNEAASWRASVSPSYTRKCRNCQIVDFRFIVRKASHN